MSNNKSRRITVKYKSANPLFEKWLREWKQEAAEKHSKQENIFNTALYYLKKYPLKCETGQECKILKGFGNKLCKMLDDKLRAYNLELANSRSDSIASDHLEKEQQSACQIREVITEHSNKNLRSTLSHINKGNKKVSKTSEGTITKTSSASSVISDFSQGLDSSPTKELPNLGKKSKKVTKTISGTSNSSADSEDFYILEPGNFDLILYVDTAETVGNNSNDPFLVELQKLLGPNQFEVKKLNVGDYIWICRCRTTQKELVLPYIIERKRLDDFASSIKDGRYKEQKFRLKRSGIENIYYLIENYRTHSLPITTLQQATFNTAIQDGFKIKMTNNLKQTAKLLNQFSKILTSTFHRKTLIKCSKENLPSVNLNDDLISLISFKEFNQNSLKNKPTKVTDLFIKMLIQLHGVSVDKALVIVERFPTPALLKKAYDECEDETSKETLLADVKCGNRKLGLALSRTLYQLFNFESY
ncbi:crossover junction endonuclease MUS81 [Diorhabda carinulata]|uniref:crossover junction endonuclease MUS81 n=1 Tax=Diorhabda carinulata TaxID=1163345 RepID=UPI0025A03D44|nr:crossover junction endonuclease MUS81 [Diorhabda carinulata]